MVKNKEHCGAFYSRIIGMKLSRGELIYCIDSDDMISVPNALEDLYNISKLSKVDTIEFNAIKGEIGKYNKVIQAINSEYDYNKILYGKDIINKRYLLNHKILRKPYGALWIKLFRKRIKEEIINYVDKLGLDNYKDWNYGDDQFLTDLIKIFSEKYLYINKIYYFYFVRQNSISTKVNQYKDFLGHMRYFYLFDTLVKKYKLSADFLICNIISFLNIKFDLSASDCKYLYNLTVDINLNRRNMSNYWKENNRKLKGLYKKFCKLFN